MEKLGLTLIDWQTAAEENKAPRIEWRDILGKPLTAFVYERLQLGLKREEIIEHLYLIAQAKAKIENKELARIISIDVSARISEYNRKRV